MVSVVMPSYNTGKYIGESIESVINQSYTDWELIIVDDCSTDNTDDEVKKYLFDSRIKYFKNEKNSGAAVSRNRALREAKGKWIAFLDSDDLWETDKLTKQLNFMIEKGYYFSYTNYKEIDDSSNLTGVKITGPEKVTKHTIYNFCYMGCLSVMYDADYMGLLQINDIKKNNDYAMWLKLCKKSSCYLLDEDLARYRRGRKGSISTHKYSTLIKWHYKLYRICDGKNPFSSALLTFRNLIFGVIKKIKYVKG